MEESILRFNMVGSFLTNVDETVVLMRKGSHYNTIWRMVEANIETSLINVNEYIDHTYLVASYSPAILYKLESGLRFNIAYNGVMFLCCYYNVSATNVEINSVASSDHSTYPSTSTECVKASYMKWLTKLLMDHWGIIETVKDDAKIITKPTTFGEFCVFGNFSAMPGVF